MNDRQCRAGLHKCRTGLHKCRACLHKCRPLLHSVHWYSELEAADNTSRHTMMIGMDCKVDSSPTTHQYTRTMNNIILIYSIKAWNALCRSTFTHSPTHLQCFYTHHNTPKSASMMLPTLLRVRCVIYNHRVDVQHPQQQENLKKSMYTCTEYHFSK